MCTPETDMPFSPSDDAAQQRSLRIRDLTADEKPREKAISKGLDALTDVELLRSGVHV